MSQPLDLEAIKARAEAATPGEWKVWFTNSPLFIPKPLASGGHAPYAYGENPPPSGLWRVEGDCWEDEDTVYLPTEVPFTDADADFVAHAREDIPALVAEVERLKKIINEYRSRTISYRVDL